jgi:hypothetical protein
VARPVHLRLLALKAKGEPDNEEEGSAHAHQDARMELRR